MNFLSLSSVFSNLTKSFSTSFLLVGVFPSISFLIFNAAITYLLSRSFRSQASFLWQETTVAKGAFLAAVSAIGVLTLAYSLTALATRLRKLLEGDWPSFFSKLRERGIQTQSANRAKIEQQIRKVYKYRRIEQETDSWTQDLIRARNLGSRHRTGQTWPAGAANPIQNLKASRDRYELISDTEIRKAVRSVQNLLLSYDADSDTTLDQLQLDLNDLIDYAIARAQQEHFQLFNFLQLNYGSGMIAPTQMGNIAASIQAYAVKRYNFNLELFWSSLQKCIQKDKEFAPVLEDAKARLDFLVVSFWLTVGFVIFWSILLPFVGHWVMIFIVLVITGPPIAYLWYRAAIEQYRAFADAIKTGIDLFRIDLLDSLHVRRPSDFVDEQDMWRYLNGITEYGEEGNFRFEFPVKS
jgi:hypothetical protein